MGTNEDRRAEARMETIDERFDRYGVSCADCGYRWVPGRGTCPRCGGAPADPDDEPKAIIRRAVLLDGGWLGLAVDPQDTVGWEGTREGVEPTDEYVDRWLAGFAERVGVPVKRADRVVTGGAGLYLGSWSLLDDTAREILEDAWEDHAETFDLVSNRTELPPNDEGASS